MVRVHLTGVRGGAERREESLAVSEESLDELAALAESAGAQVIDKVLQSRPAFDQATLIGAGKLEELEGRVKAAEIDLVLLDHELGGTQQRNLEKRLGVKVIDRTQLILDIFARRARTREGQLQVELAQLKYLLPRLTGRGAAMSRLGGGIGTRGPGETKLETDRRRIHIRIKKIERDLAAVRGSRGVQRRLRQAVPLTTLALVGYTNAGKSTLFDRLTQSGVAADARMFATLDPTVRQLMLPSRRKVLLSDTVGFIRKLPTALIAALPGQVVLTGSDPRGVIYAIYEFSHRYLGVEPLYWWTDNEPAPKPRVRIPAGLRLSAGPPAFRYRGWFVNDEDLLTGWAPGDKDGTGISLAVWDKLYEALLRTKGNMIVPGTFLFPDEPQMRLASERGLILTQHHIEVLQLNTFRWPDDLPYSIFRRPDLLERAWRNAVRQHLPEQEVIWTVGFRGRHDRPFWSDDAEAPTTDAERGAAIQRAIGAQMAIVRAERRDPYFLMNAWMEAVELIQKGVLRIPDGVTLVWPDNGHGLIRDAGTIARGQGVYYHTAMYNSHANQLTEMVPLERIYRELGRAHRAGATEYLLDNISDFRPVLMTTRALMEYAWDPAAADGFLARWCREEFGERAAPAAARIYQDYFAAPGRYGPEEHHTLADNAYFTMVQGMLSRHFQGDTRAPTRPFAAPDLAAYSARVRDVTREAAPRWEALEKRALALRARIPSARQEFFQAHVLTQIAFQRHANLMLGAAAEALEAPADAAARFERAAAEARAAIAALKAAEAGKWKGFHDNDIFVKTVFTLRMIEACLAKASGDASAALPPAPPPNYDLVKAYQGSRRVAVD